MECIQSHGWRCKLPAEMSTQANGSKKRAFAWTLLLALTLVVNHSRPQTDALKVSAAIPELVKLNDAFWLNCSHQKPLGDAPANQVDGAAATEDIYAIKWFKDNEEFYKYSPNANPKVSIYETNGIQLDQSKSHEGNVLLSKADVNTEGEYRCEILSEAPLFETVRKSKHLRVYALPVKSPKIDILDANGRAKSPKEHDISYAIGDKIDLICNSAPSKPAARLRWYLNEREIQVPASNNSAGLRRQRRALGSQRHDVRVTPIEYRQHYKGIYSSHSTLSLVLQQDDLINNKISFKCLASMRQDVPFKSKQLIVLMQAAAASTAARLSTSGSLGTRFKRSSLSSLSSDFQATIAGLADNEAHVLHRQRPSHHKHSISRLPPPLPSPAEPAPSAYRQLQQRAGNNQMWYIYEEADSTLGPSIIDKPEDLESYLKRNGAQFNDSAPESGAPLEFNKADNVDYIQALRDRHSRQRTYATTNLHQTRPRLHSPGTFVKSPHYSDEHDQLRPVIGWPPLDSGKLMLLGNSLVALPTQKNSANIDRKYILPPKESELDAISASMVSQADADESQSNQMMIERLMNNLNCTCTDGAIDTKMSWIINDIPLDLRYTRLYPTRVSPDHKQTWLTIGLQVPNGNQLMFNPTAKAGYPAPASLSNIMAQYYKSPETTSKASSQTPGNQQNALYDQIKFTCQALYSMLLYSSSETITFDFSPHTLVDGNSIDKPLLPSNVIQATSASQSSSAHGRTMDIQSARSQTNYVMTLISLVLFVSVTRR